MHIPKRLLRLAKDRALASFSTLAEQTVVEADSMTTRAMNGADALELRDLNVVRGFLRGEARTLRTRMDRHFAGLLERAMVTMHADTRGKSTHAIDYSSLTLVDDDTLVRQIEVERMVARLRDAESGPLGRVNLTIAVMHNDREARERENPFRPYLLARALFEALRELMWEESQSKLLFDALGQAMARRLPGFYAGILEVFEAGGVSARLTARPGAMSRADKDRKAWLAAARQAEMIRVPGAPEHPDQKLHDQLMPRLQRLREIAAAAAGAAGGGARTPDLQELIWNMFHQPQDNLGEPRIPGLCARSALDGALLAQQQAVAGGAAPPAPMALRALLGETAISAEQARTLDVGALLFESILHDDLLGEPMRAELGRLFLPLMRAAVLEPELLHDARHPARRLIDRLGSLGARLTPELPAPVLMADELRQVVGAVLDLFDDDMAIFSDAEQALDAHVTAQLSAVMPGGAACVDALAEAGADSARLSGANAALSAMLQPLQVDPRLADFLLGTWARVLSHPGPGADAARALLPELLWSAQEKSTPEERSALMRMLPELVRQVREGMASIALPEAPSKAAFDRLVAVHMDVLAGKQEFARRQMTLEQFRHHLRDFAIDERHNAGDGWLGGFELEAALARRGVVATLHTRAAARMSQSSDAELLAWARPGTGFEVSIDGRFRPALLCAAPAGNSAFLFFVVGEKAPLIYLGDPMLEALEQGTVRPLENAPLFDRAVESLMAGAESLSS